MSRVLVVRYRKMGDSIMVTPILRSLAQMDHRFTVVTQPGLRPFFGESSHIDDYVNVSSERPSKWEAVRLGIQARRHRCEVGLALRFDRTAALITRWAGCRIRAGSLARSSSLLTINVARTEAFDRLHQVEKYYAVAEAAVAGTLAKVPTHWSERGYTLPAPVPLNTPERWVALHLDNGGSNQLWPESHLVVVAERLRASGFRICTTGSAGCSHQFAAVRKMADLDLVGKTSPFGLATAFYACHSVLGIDGGGPRIASAVGCPVVTVGLGDRWSEHQMSPWMAPGRALYRPEGSTPDEFFHALLSIM